jgi:hypothetical protein
MDPDIVQLASQVAPILIPYLVKGEEAFASEFGKKIAAALWGKFKPKIEAKKAAQEAVEDVIKSPDDQGAQLIFERQIQEILERDPKFAEEIQITVGDVTISSIQAGDYSQNLAMRDMTGSNVIVGNSNTQTNIGT